MDEVRTRAKYYEAGCAEESESLVEFSSGHGCHRVKFTELLWSRVTGGARSEMDRGGLMPPPSKLPNSCRERRLGAQVNRLAAPPHESTQERHARQHGSNRCWLRNSHRLVSVKRNCSRISKRDISFQEERPIRRSPEKRKIQRRPAVAKSSVSKAQ